MAQLVKVKVRGIKQAQKNLKRITNRVLQAQLRGLVKVGKKIEAASKRNAPIDTGNLKASAYTIWPQRKYIVEPVFKRVGRRSVLSHARLAQIYTGHRSVVTQTAIQMQLPALLKEAKVQIGHTVFYATQVHEDMKQAKNKFLQKAFQAYQSQLLPTVRAEISKVLKTTQLDRFHTIARDFASGSPIST